MVSISRLASSTQAIINAVLMARRINTTAYDTYVGEAMASEDFEWVSENLIQLQEKYARLFIAVWKRQVIGVGESPSQAIKQARERVTESNPLVEYVPDPKYILVV